MWSTCDGRVGLGISRCCSLEQFFILLCQFSSSTVKNFSKDVPNGNNGDCVKIKAECYIGRKNTQSCTCPCLYSLLLELQERCLPIIWPTVTSGRLFLPSRQKAWAGRRNRCFLLDLQGHLLNFQLERRKAPWNGKIWTLKVLFNNCGTDFLIPGIPVAFFSMVVFVLACFSTHTFAFKCLQNDAGHNTLKCLSLQRFFLYLRKSAPVIKYMCFISDLVLSFFICC